MEANLIIEELDFQKEIFMRTKSYFPSMSKKLIGKTEISTAPYYRQHGYDTKFLFRLPLTDVHIKKHNEISNWINQNFIIRSCAIMESRHIISKTTPIDKKIEGWKELDLLRRLRNVFAHGSGKYNNNRKHKKLAKDLIDYFKLATNLIEIEQDKEFPISIDKVCIPLLEGCKKYVKSFCKP